jgi:protein subunit release factor B
LGIIDESLITIGMHPSKEEELRLRMERLKIQDSDLIEKFILGSGSGGQKINKTSSCVYLKHIPTGIEIKCQRSRSRELNRTYAKRELCDRLEELLFQEKSKRQQEREKIRRQKKRRSRKSQEKILAAKRGRSEIKKLRKVEES